MELKDTSSLMYDVLGIPVGSSRSMTSKRRGIAVVFASIMIAAIANPSIAETPSSPGEIAATAQLNRDVAAANAAADARYDAEMKQYRGQKDRNDLEKQQYMEEMKKNALLQQQYQEQLRTYQATQASKK